MRCQSPKRYIFVNKNLKYLLIEGYHSSILNLWHSFLRSDALTWSGCKPEYLIPPCPYKAPTIVWGPKHNVVWWSQMRLRHKTTNFGVPDFNASKKLSVKELSEKTIKKKLFVEEKKPSRLMQHICVNSFHLYSACTFSECFFQHNCIDQT